MEKPDTPSQRDNFYGVQTEPVPEGNLFHRATAFVLEDTHQVYVVHNGLRNALRALIVFAIFGAVIGFTIGKYVTDDDLRTSTITVREDNVGDVSQSRIEVALCPCRNETFPWSTFATYQEPLSSNFSATTDFCQQQLVPELKTLPPLTLDSPANETRAWKDALAALQNNTATLIACNLAVQEILAALDPNPDAHVIGLGNNFYSTELLSETQLQQRMDTFIGGQVLLQSQSLATQLALQQVLLTRVDAQVTDIVFNVKQVNDSDAGAAADVIETIRLVFQTYQNITTDALSALTESNTDPAYIDTLLNTLRGAVTVNYTAYEDACMAFYCDYTRNKSAWSRLTEFLGLLGGLYTTFLGVGFTLWWFLDFFLPSGHR